MKSITLGSDDTIALGGGPRKAHISGAMYDPNPSPAPAYAAESGRSAAFLVYVLYLLSIPSAAILALAGVIVAYVARGTAQGAALAHLDDQIRVWWIAFMWGAGLLVAGLIGAALTIVLIGFPILWLAALIGFIVMVWFTVKGLLGLLALLDGRAPR